jgi:2-polyprenyl-3-methyl-5-hydroxy-6-metoxy-1,4-benzoquinol methylase
MKTNDTRFEFGENWANYSKTISTSQIDSSIQRILQFFEEDDLIDKKFLDIGSGSGIHSLAALKLGVSELVAFDYDENSVNTTKDVLIKNWNKNNYRVFQGDILEGGTGDDLFDIVYSWGVLHHTGNLKKALKNAAELTRKGGFFMFSVYGKTRYCKFWKRIKKWYCNATDDKKAFAERLYVKLFGFYLLLRFKSLNTHIRNYSKNKRGMNFYYDVRDWMGGYPYESISRKEIHNLMTEEGLGLVRENVRKRSGLFGSGCDEYLFEKKY